MSADELKTELKARKLSEHGTKAVLQDRLREAVAAPSAAPAAAPTPPRPDEYWLHPSPASDATHASFGDDELMFDVLPFAGEDDPPAGDGGDRPTTHVHVHPPVHALTAANRTNNAEWQRRDEDGSRHTSSLNYMGDRAFLELKDRRELGRIELAQTILARHGPHTLLGEEADVPRVSGVVASLYDDQKLASRQSVMMTKERRAQTRAILAFYKHLGPLGAIDQCGEYANTRRTSARGKRIWRTRTTRGHGHPWRRWSRRTASSAAARTRPSRSRTSSRCCSRSRYGA